MSKFTKKFCGGEGRQETFIHISCSNRFMRTFDRAMYAMFLLVLLADVARAESVSPGRVDSSARLILSAATHDRVSLVSGTVRELQANAGEVRSTPPARSFGEEFISSYRTAARMYSVAPSGAMRSMFDGSSFAAIATFAALPGANIAPVFVQRLMLDAPAIPVIEHTGSPAP
jgi:hypothetical protein